MKDSWLRAAISDDTLVAAFLLRLKHSPPPPSSSSSMLPSWGLRLPRSKQLPPTSTATTTTTTTSSNVLVFDSSNNNGNKNKRGKESSTHGHGRLSPTTPLSWAGAASSPSDDSHSSLHVTPLSDPFRSKVSSSFQTPFTTTSKRPRKKKTFAELREEESSLLKERICLKKELDTIRLRVKEQRSINENLKRVKLDLHVESRINSEVNLVDERINNMSNTISEAASSSVTRLVHKIDDACELNFQKLHAASQEQLFMLPDLNMAPEDTVGTS